MTGQKLMRIIIQGKTATDVQGIGLRDKIQRIAKDMVIKGMVRNVKGEPKVEIICEAERANELYERIEKLKNEIRGNFIVNKPSAQLFDEFDDFYIKREDDLTEMVWGLQGAGKAFKEAEKMREENRKRMLIKSLTQELNSILVHIDKLRHKEPVSSLRVICLENFLREPPLDINDDLMKNLNDLYDLCVETNDLLKNGDGEYVNIIMENLNRIEHLVITIEQKIGGKDENINL